MTEYGLIDDKNVELWNGLKKVHEIEIQLEERNDYLAYSENGKTIIYVSRNDINPASFTHELLHIFLRIKKIFIGAALQLFIKEKPTISKIFSQALIEHIGNCLDHIKMLPEFLKLGYDRKDFLSDYSSNKLTKEDLKNLKINFVANLFFTKYYNASAIDFFIGKYFAVKACPNNFLDYSNGLNELKSINEELYFILEKFFTAWSNFDYNDQDPITGSYYFFLFEFVDELENWTIGKQIK